MSYDNRRCAACNAVTDAGKPTVCPDCPDAQAVTEETKQRVIDALRNGPPDPPTRGMWGVGGAGPGVPQAQYNAAVNAQAEINRTAGEAHAEVARLEKLARERYDLACKLDGEVERLRERVAALMLEEPSKTAGLYAAIDELVRERGQLREEKDEAQRQEHMAKNAEARAAREREEAMDWLVQERTEAKRLRDLLQRAASLFPIERPEWGGDPEWVAAIKRDVADALGR